MNRPEGKTDVTQAIRGTTREVVSVRRFGVRQNPLADNTKAFNDAVNYADENGIDTVDLAGLTLHVEENLYLHGNVSIVNGGIRYTAIPTNDLYWINCGNKGHGATSGNGLINSWLGAIRGVKFSTVSGLENDIIRLINVFWCKDAIIEHCEFDLTETADICSITSVNNSNYVNGFSRNGLMFRHLEVNITPGEASNEGIGMSELDRGWIIDCNIKGCVDDPIGLHNVNFFRISDNWVESTQGRILFSNCTNGVVENNDAFRIEHPDNGVADGGALLYCDIESTTRPRPENVDIVNNRLYHHPDIDGTTFGIRLRGMKGCNILGNKIHNFDNVNGKGIRVEDHQRTGWEDPTDFESGDIAKTRDIFVDGNIAPDFDETVTGSAIGTVRLGSNYFGSVASVSKNRRVIGNLTGAITINFDELGQNTVLQLISNNATFTVQAQLAGYYTLIVQQAGAAGWTIGFDTSITGTPPATNDGSSERTLFHLYYDGQIWYHR